MALLELLILTATNLDAQTLIYSILIFFLGASVGSFVNVIILRHNTGLSPWRGSSKCFSCGTKLRFYDLIPIFSFFFLRGRCRLCSTKLSLQYWLSEVITGIAFVLIFYLHGFSYQSLLLSTIYCVLSAIFIYDLRHKIIPDSFLFVFGLLSLSYSYFILHISYLGILVGLLLVPLPFLIIWLASSGRYIGFGDVKFMGLMGMLLGFKEGLSAVLFSFWIGFVYVMFLFLYAQASKLFNLPSGRKEITMKSELPFAPFLVLGTLLGLFLNVDLISTALLN